MLAENLERTNVHPNERMLIYAYASEPQRIQFYGDGGVALLSLCNRSVEEILRGRIGETIAAELYSTTAVLCATISARYAEKKFSVMVCVCVVCGWP